MALLGPKFWMSNDQKGVIIAYKLKFYYLNTFKEIVMGRVGATVCVLDCFLLFFACWAHVSLFFR